MEAFIKLIHQFTGMSEEDAKVRLAGSEALQIEEMIQGQISKAKEGDTSAFKFIIEIMCGKIPEIDESRTVDEMTTEEKLRAVKKAVEMLEAEAATKLD